MNISTNIFERIAEIAEKKGFSSINKFAIEGLNYKSAEKINRLKNPKNKPSFEIIQDIITAFGDVNVKWLITGEGEIDLYDNVKPSSPTVYPSKTDRLLNSQRIPLYETEAVAGIVPIFDDFESKSPIDFLQIPHAPKCDGAIYASGDSMYPIIKSGDILGYKQIQDLKNDIFWGQMYILYIEVAGDTMLTVKYIHRGKDELHVKLVSENRHHEPKEVNINKIKALAQVKITVRIN